MACETGAGDGLGLGGGNWRIKSNIDDKNFLISFSYLCMSAGMIFGGVAKTIGLGGAFMMASDGSGAVATGVLAGIPTGPKVAAFGPAELRCGSRVGI